MLMYGKTNTVLSSNYPPIKINKFKLKKEKEQKEKHDTNKKKFIH